MIEDNRGFYNKYYIFKRTTGEEVKGDRFVLNPEKDFAARKALEAYAANTPNIQLGNEIRAWVNRLGD